MLNVCVARHWISSHICVNRCMCIVHPECDVSVSKLLGFETFPFFWWFRIRYRKILESKKVSVSVSEKFGIKKSIGFGIGKIWYRKKVSDSVLFRFWVLSHTVCLPLEIQNNTSFLELLPSHPPETSTCCFK